MKKAILRVLSSYWLAGGLFLAGAILVGHFHYLTFGLMVTATGLLLALYQDIVGHIVTLARQLAHDVMQGRRAQPSPPMPPGQLPVWLELTWFTILAVGILAFVITLLSGNAGSSMPIMEGLGIVVSVLGAYEWRLHLKSLWQRSWALPLGKFLIATLAGVSLSVTTGQARQFTYALTGENPDAFPAFVRLLSFVFMPLLCFTAACVVAMLWAVVVAARTGLNMLARATVAKLKDWKSLLRMRSNGVANAPSHSVERMRKAIHILRPISMLAASMWLVGFTPDIDPNKYPRVHAVALAVLTQMDYWPQAVCGHASHDPAARLDDSHYSIALKQGWHITLRTESCQYVPDMDRFDASVTRMHAVLPPG